MRSSVIISAFVAVLVGFGGSVVIVISAAEAVGATQAQTSSWIAVLCVSMMVTTAILSVTYRMPIVTAWSTPGAALIATSTGVNINMAVGAFIVCALLIILTAMLRPLGAAIQRIPTSIATAILAGVLFPFVLAIVVNTSTAPMLGLPMIALFVIVRLFSPSWAVICTLGLGIALSYAFGLAQPSGHFAMSELVWVRPEFDLASILGVGIPLYLVTMASQNLPGFAVLGAAGYTPPSRAIFAVTGIASLLSAGFGAHTTSLAAITASICTNSDAHPDKEKRWLCGPFYAVGYGILAFFGASLVALFASFPHELIAIVAGVALMAPFVNSLATSFAEQEDHLPSTITFIITASGMSFFGIASAFWGLVAGLILMGLSKFVSTYLKKSSGP